MKNLILLLLLFSVATLRAQSCEPSLVVSYDHGQNWDFFSPGLPAGVATALASDDDGTLWAAVRTGGVMRLRPDANKWELSGPGLPFSTYYSALAVRGELLVVSTGDGGDIFYSRNGSKSWQKALWGGPTSFVSDLVFLNDWEVLAATREGLYYSADGGQSWALRHKMILMNGMFVRDGILYLSAYWDGLYASGDYGVSVDDCLYDGVVQTLSHDRNFIYLRGKNDLTLRKKFGAEGWENPVLHDDPVFRYRQVLSNRERLVAVVGEDGC